MSCRSCGGSGRCRPCGGSGNGKRVVTHPSKGLVNPDTGAVKCPGCNGSGKCSGCGGSGRD